MQKTKYSFIIAAASNLANAAFNVTTIFTLVIMLKLLYFSSQIGDGHLGELYSYATLGSLLMLVSVSLLLNQRASVW